MTSRRRSTLLISAAALVLAACGSGSDTIESESAPAETEPAPAETEPASVETEPASVETEPAPVETEPAPVETEPAPVETEPAPVETEPAPVEPDGNDASCLVGDWKILAEDANDWYDQIEASLTASGAPDVEFTITGELFLSFTPTEYVYEGDFTLDLALAGQEGSGVATGGVDGTWEAVDGILTTMLGESDLNLVITVAGTTIDGSDLGNGFLNSVPINNAPFDCEGPTIGFQVGDDGAERYPVLLTPA